MIWICAIVLNLLIGVFMGVIVMYYRDRNLLKNQKILFDELQNNKAKLNEYQKRLNNHFTDNIELIKRIAENYQELYQNMTKSASFFLPNTYTQDNVSTFDMNNIHDQNKKPLSMKAPLDYSDNTKILRKNNDTE